MSVYRQIIKKSLALVLRKRYFWFFGFFAALLGIEGEFGIIFKAFDKIGHGKPLFPALQKISTTGIFSADGLTQIGKTFVVDPFAFFMVLFIAVVVIAITIFVIWLIVVSQAALISHTGQAEKGKSVTMQSGFDVGMKNFSQLFSINFLSKLVIFLILFIFLLPLYSVTAENNHLANDYYYYITFIILIALSLVISFIAKFASIYVVLGKERIWPSLEKGWNLFKNNWLITLEMAAFLFVIVLLIGLSLFIVALLVIIPFSVILSFAVALQSTAFFWFLVSVLITCCFIIFTLLFAIVGAFHWSCWTMLFNRLDHKGSALSRVQRWANLAKKPKRKKKKR